MRKWKPLTALLLSSALLVSAVSALPVNVSGAGETALSLNNPSIKDGVTTWDCVEFGQYWQKDTNGDGKVNNKDEKTPIKWRVLSVSDDDVFLMADQCLDWMTYDDPYGDPATTIESTWQKSFLRFYLNETFMSDSFSEDEINALKTVTVHSDSNTEDDTEDKVYILSYSDICNTAYGFDADAGSASNSRCIQKTAFAENRYYWAPGDKNDCGWWLRTVDGSQAKAKVVQSDGSISEQSTLLDKGVCPVVHVKLSVASTIKKVSSVSSKSENPAATQKPTSTKKPSSTTKPNTTKKPSSTTKPNTTKKPSSTTRPVTTKKPATTKKKTTTKKEVIKGKAPKFTVKYKKKGKAGSYNVIQVKIKLPKKAAGYQVRFKYPKYKTWQTHTLTSRSNIYGFNTYLKGTHKIQVRYYTKDRASYSKWSKTKNFKVKKIYKPKASDKYVDDGVG